MKNFSFVLNAVLLLAVGFLYYYNFSGSGKKTSPSVNEGLTKSPDTVKHHFSVACVDFDSLNAKIVSLNQHRKDIEQEQRKIDADVNEGYKKIEAKKLEFTQKNPNATPEQIQRISNELMQDQQNIEESKQERLRQLNQRSFTLLEDVKNKLKEFLAVYNKDKKYQYILMTGTGLDYMIYKDSTLDITNDVINGMNEKLKQKQ